MYGVKNGNFYNGGIRYQEVYIAKKIDSKQDDYGNVIPQYSIPKKYMMQIMPLTENIDIQTFGETSHSVKVAVLSYQKFKNIFNNFDVAYLNGASPENEKINGENSNYTLKVREQNEIIKLYFQEKIKGEIYGDFNK